jgi:surface protein
MSISITKQPLKYNLAVGKNLWTLSGATQSNQLYLTGVLVNGTTASILESPKNPAGVTHIDISRILKTKLAPENIETIDTFANASTMILDYRLNYGNKLGLTQSFTTLSNVKYVLNGYKPENIIDWNYTNHIPFSVIYDTCEELLGERIRFSTKFQQLSNYPTTNNIPTYKIFNDEYQTQTIFNVIEQSDEVVSQDLINIAPSFVKWTFYDENNTILKEHIESINLTTGAGPFDDECTIGTQSTLERILHIPSGTQNLKDAGIYPTGSNADLVKRYKVGVWTRDTCLDCPPDFDGFIMKVNTTLTASGTSNANSIRLPLIGENYFVDWGDGNVEYNLTQTAEPVSPSLTTNHTYATGGTYSIKIGGGLSSIKYNNQTGRDRLKLIDIEQWGNINWNSFNSAFYGCSNFNNYTTTDVPNLSNVTDMSSMFRNTPFNSNINNWNVSNVTAMANMFRQATSFNQNINDWDTSSVTTMREMFRQANSFNQPLNDWDTSSVSDMVGMFQINTAFNQDLDNWNTSNVNSMLLMFGGASAFNGDVTTWNTSNVTNMGAMFAETNAFNQDISGWNTSNVTLMANMFNLATAFNQDISSWNVNNVSNFTQILDGATLFNQDLGTWTLREEGTNLIQGLNNSGLSTENYSRTLIGWANYANTNGGQPSGVTLGATGLSFSSTNYGGSPYDNAVDARNYLLSIGWTITGDTEV